VLMATKAIYLPNPKRPTEVNKTNDPKYCLYHRIISNPIKACYVFKDIIEDTIRRGEIEIKGAPPKGSTTSSNATLLVEQKDESYPSSSETNEGIPTVSLPPHAVPIKFIADDDVAIVWAYLDMPPPLPGILTLHDFYLDLNLDAWEISEDDDEDFEWQTYFSRRPFQQGEARASKSLGVKMIGQKLPQKKNKKNKKKKSRAKKKPEITSKEECVSPVKTPFTLGDCNPKGPLGSDSSNDDPTEGEVAQYCMVS